MRRAGEKLKSNRGASLFVALLLFLVCAVVGSAVLTAGTAASGRMSQIAESDQRFYSVNSAAGLLIDLLQDVTVKSELVIVKDGDLVTSETIKVYKVDPDTKTYVLSDRTKSLPLDLAHRLAENSSSTIKLTLSDDTSDPSSTSAALPTAITGTTISAMLSKEKLTFTIQSPKAKDTDPVYSQTLTFVPDIRETQSVKTVDTRTITTTETSITWKLSDVK